VVLAVDGLSDQVPPARDPDRFAGNHVVLACQDVKVVLAHLMPHSIVVEEGTRVDEGQEIARVGNSGQTTQPHLHIHAERGGTPTTILDGKGVPITFEGRFLERNSLFTGN
jgi:murein DD-endopeptidase MepM/ murein hydrolase activator NlpD